jgi:hypothetical protein
MVWQLLVIKDLGTCKDPLDTTLMGLDTIHNPNAKIQHCSIETDSDHPIILMIPVEFR